MPPRHTFPCNGLQRDRLDHEFRELPSSCQQFDLLILQITLIGWIPAAIWAVYALSQYNTDKKIAAAHGKD